MKRILVFLLLAVALPTALLAQNTPDPKAVLRVNEDTLSPYMAYKSNIRIGLGAFCLPHVPVMFDPYSSKFVPFLEYSRNVSNPLEIGISSGFQLYTSKTEKIDSNSWIVSYPVDESDSPDTSYLYVTHRLPALSLSLSLRYHPFRQILPQQSKWDFYAMGQMGLSIVKNPGLNLNMGLGFSYDLKPNLAVFAETTAGYHWAGKFVDTETGHAWNVSNQLQCRVGFLIRL